MILVELLNESMYARLKFCQYFLTKLAQSFLNITRHQRYIVLFSERMGQGNNG